MRHVYGIVLGVVAAAAVYAGAGWGVARITDLHGSGASLTGIHGLLALAAVAGTGLLLGVVLAVPQVSPLAAGLPGIAMLAWTALLAISSRRALALLPPQGTSLGHTLGAGMTMLLAGGILGLAGAAMIVPLFVPSRWRGRDDDEADVDMPEEASLLR
jgi:hypothetical protein